MICVSIGRGRHRQMIAEHRHLASQGAKLVELRVDYINGDVNLKRLLSDRPCPAVVACRRPADGGKWHGTEQARQLLLRTAIVEGVEYIDLEDDIAGSIPRFGKTKRIISFHDFKKTPEDLEAIHKRLSGLNADIVKLATMATQFSDNSRMMLLVRNAKIPTIGMCMGDIGTPTRILCGRFGAPFTYATFHQERVLAPGQLSYEQMRDIYHYDDITPETGVFGVIGDPIAHSLSPHVHNAAFREHKLDNVYVPFRVTAEHLDQFLTDARGWGIRGLSVTIPHKETVISRLTKIDPAVKGVGAANTVLINPEDLLGFNTDYRAAVEAVERAMDPTPSQAGSLTGKKALILGAGGAARAVAYGFKRRGAEVSITNRTFNRAQELADLLKCKAVEWNNRHAIPTDVLVNCTPIGMHPNVDESPYDRRHLRPYMVVFDNVYNPENTLLIKEARSQSCTVVTGVEMFVRQASLQYKLFTGQDAPWEVIRDVLKRATASAKY